MKRLNYGELYRTGKVEKLMKSDDRFHSFVAISFGRYLTHNWGNVPDPMLFMNNEALEHEDNPIVGIYTEGNYSIVIKTEWDRSRTTIMMKEEYEPCV